MQNILFFICLAACSPCLGQNALLDLYRPFYQSLTPLRTDSLFLRTSDGAQKTEREIAFTYDESLLTEWRELCKSGKQVIKTKQQISYPKGQKVALTETRDSLNQQTVRNRLSVLGNNPEHPDGYLMEMWQKDQWIPVQQTLFTYDRYDHVLQRLEQRTSFASSEWANSSAWNYTYDGQGRMTTKRLDDWADGDWKTSNLYRYEYKGRQSEPYSATRLSDIDGQLTPIDSTITWYDQTGKADSTLVFYWVGTQSAWYATDRTVFADKAQQTARNGKNFVQDQNGKWIEREETTFTEGEGIYTDDPQEEVLRVYNAETKVSEDKRRTTTLYKPLDDGRIYGSIQTEEMKDGDWSETFFAEAWFRKALHSPSIDSLADRSDSERFKFSYSCGLPNPYVATQTLTFPAREDLNGNYELKIVSEEGRLIFRGSYNSSGAGYVDTPLTPGFYLVTVSKGGTPVCSQKLVVQ